MRTLELLSPAKNLACGMAAIDHGADAVYIGASRFGARAAVGNSVEDIHLLCDYAHQFGAKVYVTVNTIIYDDELDATMTLLRQLAEAGADAVLVQDMGIVRLVSRDPLLSSLTLHASTQTDNRSVEKVRWLRDNGFRRVVLARELSVEEIQAIHEAVPDVELEVFVHGALCVSYSGICYASQYCFGRSANRGECAQFCRMKFDLLDGEGQVLEHDRHLLSLKDMNQLENLERLAEAGAPFNFTMLTADTHFPDGCPCRLCEDLYDTQYANVLACSSRQVADFISWIQEQPFYENTTIMISGDHLTMDGDFMEDVNPEYTRSVYNCIIHAPVEPAREKNRQFGTFDLFPTTLAALGVTIDGDRLALGTNLFSARKTLTEQYGYNFLAEELQKQSDFYDSELKKKKK